MLCYRGMPSDWRVMPTELAKRGNCGRERISRILNELIEAGHIKKTISRDPVTQKWKAAGYTVFAVPNAPKPIADDEAREIIRDAQRVAEQPPPPESGKAAAGKPSMANPPLLTTDLPTTDSTNTTDRDRHQEEARGANERQTFVRMSSRTIVRMESASCRKSLMSG
ncbi:hypothetical protein H8A95_31425 [Bradyrhizobium sp. Pear76]|uniref:helix-turn-helix domain-containing protein n=1 Tax=Bradyrhizobium oropedii TaxID=1571201 RepID=UPI001E2C4103|nr:helix-turn-helix domain-containing protein [Bradyrhizobium oropedii]MCC8966716.1 hypothetical protein [Bradyrhizobium oropedii]